VQDPTGTTNMDFEFNQSTTTSANGVTPVRTAGDLLIIYDLAQGGTRPVLSLRTWTGSAWGPATNLTDSNKATGSINTSPIPAGEADGLGAHSARTFGEAQLALSAIFPDSSVCKSFGSAYLKSRSSDSFTAALKDFVPPVGVNISNCGSIKILKQDDAGDPLAGAEFTLYKDNAPIGGTRGTEDTITTKTCTTGADGTCEIASVVPGEYWVVETVTPAGHDTAADQHVTVKSNEQVSVTFVNIRQLGSVKITKTDDATPGKPLAGAEFTLFEDNPPLDGAPLHGGEDVATNKTCTTGADGTCTITGVLPGQYWVVETVTPAGHDTAPDQHITVNANEQTSVTFVDPRHRGAILVTKTRKHAADGPGDHPHAGVEFTVNGVTKTTDANGKACFDDLLLGEYTVHEATPAGYKGEVDKTVEVDNKASCAGDPYVGETVSFSNTPLSNITMSFESQVPGGTAATIECAGLTATPADDTPDTFDDLSETFKDLLPGTYTCTVVVDP
jgi:Prealbumin-like fold domain